MVVVDGGGGGSSSSIVIVVDPSSGNDTHDDVSKSLRDGLRDGWATYAPAMPRDHVVRLAARRLGRLQQHLRRRLALARSGLRQSERGAGFDKRGVPTVWARSKSASGLLCSVSSGDPPAAHLCRPPPFLCILRRPAPRVATPTAPASGRRRGRRATRRRAARGEPRSGAPAAQPAAPAIARARRQMPGKDHAQQFCQRSREFLRRALGFQDVPGSLPEETEAAIFTPLNNKGGVIY